MSGKAVAILGSTGSIGTQALDVCRNISCPVSALAAHSNVALLERQAREFSPALVVVRDESKYSDLKRALADTGTRVAAGAEALCEAASMPGTDIILNAVVGIAGLRPTLAALEAGKILALANKEALITGGELVMSTAKRMGASILPVDSEHSAVFQCLQAGNREDAVGMVLTASGGPFFGKESHELEAVTVEQAMAHPNWAMGAKITVDSATLMNKGLELIEAMWLFGFRPEEIEVVVHRQSVIHSAVEFRDGSVIAQLSVPDMRSAIQYALTYPRRVSFGGKKLSLTHYGSLTFQQPDLDTFVCLDTCIQAAKKGGLGACVANGANEEAVGLFLKGRIGFPQIGQLVRGAFEAVKPPAGMSLEAIEQADGMAREYVQRQV